MRRAGSSSLNFLATLTPYTPSHICRRPTQSLWAINSVGECYLHTVEVTGSNPVSPTNEKLLTSGAFLFLREVQPLPKWAQYLLALTWYSYLHVVISIWRTGFIMRGVRRETRFDREAPRREGAAGYLAVFAVHDFSLVGPGFRPSRMRSEDARVLL